MSAELYSSEISEDDCGSIIIEMNVNNHLIITAHSSNNRDIANFILPPISEGYKEAENVVRALQEWIRHSRGIKEGTK